MSEDKAQENSYFLRCNIAGDIGVFTGRSKVFLQQGDCPNTDCWVAKNRRCFGVGGYREDRNRGAAGSTIIVEAKTNRS